MRSPVGGGLAQAVIVIKVGSAVRVLGFILCTSFSFGFNSKEVTVLGRGGKFSLCSTAVRRV